MRCQAERTLQTGWIKDIPSEAVVFSTMVESPRDEGLGHVGLGMGVRFDARGYRDQGARGRIYWKVLAAFYRNARRRIAEAMEMC